MNNLKFVIIGAIAWQFICLMIYLITDGNEKAVIDTAIGIWLIPIVIIGVIFHFIKLWYYKTFYNGYKLMHNYTIASNTFYMSKRKAKQFNFDDSKVYYVKQISSGTTWKSAPYKQEVYFGGRYFKGHDMNLYKNN